MSAPIKNKEYQQHRDALNQNQDNLKNQQSQQNQKLGQNCQVKASDKECTDKQKQCDQKLNQGTQDFTQFNKEDKDKGLDQAQRREKEQNKVYGQTSFKEKNFENIQDGDKLGGQNKDILNK